MSVFDFFRQPLYALITAGGLAAAGGATYYVVVPAEKAPEVPGATGAGTQSEASPALAIIPNRIQVDMEVRARTETRNVQFQCDFSQRADQACVVPDAKVLLQRNASDPARAFINDPSAIKSTLKAGISWQDLTAGTKFSVSGKEYLIKAKMSQS